MKDITRRDFVKRAAAATVLLGTSRTAWAGANDRLRIAVLGLNGRGKSHIGDYDRLERVEVVTLCDPDARLFAPTVKAFFTDKAKAAPKVEQDIRRVLEDKDVDAISIATPNHWHSLATIWACQAGKDVYVEKPMTHNVFEGKRVVEAVKKYGRIVQHGTQLRSNPGFQEGIRLLHEGAIGRVYLARCVCYKWRPDIGKGRPGQPPKELDWNVWQGPAQEEPFIVDAKGDGVFVHYNWHWHWAYGNGDIGNQGIHQVDAARWGLGVGLPYRVTSMGGRLLWDDAKQIFDVSSTSFMFKGKDGQDKMMTLEVRPWMTNDEAGGREFGVMFFGEKGWMSFPGYGGYKMYEGRQNTLVKEREDGSDLNHYRNFVECVRSRDMAALNAPAAEGHWSSALSHYALTGARVNRVLEIDPATELVKGDEEANAHLTRKYRAPFTVPDAV
ncbi:MAG TPA: Gfo/Idh/MocA family oxidoreductase [Vicinamibacterales bacterium]|nr:Gfo/Idh/MocA family oxidoreductase [Vicinamibacterales bacterium]HOQ60153.1 Gfo/Idh/MocA family oxidoreductase [Vicinamibacterales bacterium]